MSLKLKTYLTPLRIYKSLFGNLLIPQKYAIPVDPAWPAPLHGMKLGLAVRDIRQDIKKNMLSTSELTELASIDFVVDAKKFHSDKILKGFQEYKRVEGNCNPKFSFVIPKTKEWSEELHGLKLGFVLNQMRQDVNLHKSIREAVAESGFNLTAEFPRIYSALAAFEAIRGHVNIPRSYVIQSGDARYPENTWGMKLGHALNNIRCNGAWSEHRAQLEALGVNYEIRAVRREPFDVIYSALESYKAIYGNVNIVIDFVVPHDDARYPENTWGMKLGLNLYRIRCKGSWPEHRAPLEALGVNFEVRPMRRESFDVILSALESFGTIHGHMDIPIKFVVPHNDERYLENAWGIRLGQIWSNFRHNDTKDIEL